MEMALNSADGLDMLPITAIQPIREGEEIHNTYGEKGNAELLASYGFAVPDNPFDEVLVGTLRRAAEECVGEKRVRARCRWLAGQADQGGGGGGADIAQRALNAGRVGFALKGRHGARPSRGALVFARACTLDDAEIASVNRDADAWLAGMDEGGALRCGDARGILCRAFEERTAEYAVGHGQPRGAPADARGWGPGAARMSEIVVEGEKRLLARGLRRARGAAHRQRPPPAV